MSQEIMDFELAEDVQEFVKTNFDIEFKKPDIEKKIFDSKKSDLLKVVKTIDSPTTFISVDKVDDEFVLKKL